MLNAGDVVETGDVVDLDSELLIALSGRMSFACYNPPSTTYLRFACDLAWEWARKFQRLGVVELGLLQEGMQVFEGWGEASGLKAR